MIAEREKINENGMITVEAVLSLIPFTFIILTIILFINIFAVHNKIQYAVTNAANEISGYTYLYQALGIRGADKTYQEDRENGSKALMAEVDDLMALVGAFDSAKGSVENLVSDPDLVNIGSNFDQVVTNIEGIKDAGENAVESTKYLINNPKEILSGIIYIATGNLSDWLKGKIAGGWAQYLTTSFLDTSGSSIANEMGIAKDADGILKFYGVVDGVNGLDFSDSTVFTDEDLSDIDIVVKYKVRVPMLSFLFFNPEVEVVQRVKRKCWLDGDGRTGYYHTGQE